MEQLKTLLEDSMGPGLYQMTLSNAKDKEKSSKKKVRPLMMKGQLCFQTSSFVGTQVFHENKDQKELLCDLLKDMQENFRQLELDTKDFHAVVLVSKKGKITIKKKIHQDKSGVKQPVLTHNKVKNYILEEGKPVPFLVDLGVQTKEGRIVSSRYDKFRQINRFLEFIQDILPKLPRDRQVHIIDFGCGKSYLTFAMYYYLHELKGLNIKITGLDLKKEVIRHCSELAEKYGYENLTFLYGDIADYTGTDQADMVVTLHACDTATDYALYKAVKWNASVILSVPCCQHEVNSQIQCEQLEGALRYGLIKERLSALFTDALRADILEEKGYDTQILEFIDMEHTPKNILIRALKRDKFEKVSEKMEKKKNAKEETASGTSADLAETLNVHTTLQKLFEMQE